MQTGTGAEVSSPRAPVRARRLAGAFLLLALLGAPSCSDTTTAPDGPVPAASLSFLLADSTSFAFSGPAAWPPSGTGVIARMDSAGRTLQVVAYRQTAGKPGTLAGPEPRFDLLYFEISDTAAIAPGSYAPSAVLFCRDLSLAALDSSGYAGTAGTLTFGLVTGERIGGTFSLTAVRGTDSAVISIVGGRFDAPWSSPLLGAAPGDSGDAGGSIQVLADTGTAPMYLWSGGPVYALSVARTGAPAVLAWGIVAAGGDSIASGVRHGQVPPGAFSVAASETVLVRGVSYRVTVSRINGAFGWRVFTP